MSYNLIKKKILITGSSGGIGKALCNKFIEKDCILICTSSSLEKLEILKKKFGEKHFYYKIDLSNMDEVSENMKLITQNHKDIDILINNAGSTKDNLFLRMKSDQWNDILNINLNSHFYIIKEILPLMIKNRRGNIIGISSIVALTGNPGQANYTASKSAMIGMYKSLALEVGQRNVRVNIIAPGFIQSPMTQKLNENQVNNILEKIPLKKLGSPEDIANLACFLSSQEASYITGQTFHVNGGMLMI